MPTEILVGANIKYNGQNYPSSSPLVISDAATYTALIANVISQELTASDTFQQTATMFAEYIAMGMIFLSLNITPLYALYKGSFGGSIMMDTSKGILSDITPFQLQ